MWIIGIVDIDDESHGLFTVIEEKSEKILLPKYKEMDSYIINRKSLIIADGWAAYHNLKAYHYNHTIEMHNRGFCISFRIQPILLKGLECYKA